MSNFSPTFQLICSLCHKFPFLFCLPQTWLFKRNAAGVSRIAEDAYPTAAHGPCCQFLVESEFLICFCYFVCMILVTSFSLLWMSVFHVWSLCLDYIILITAVTLVPLIILSCFNVCGCSKLGRTVNPYIFSVVSTNFECILSSTIC